MECKKYLSIIGEEDYTLSDIVEKTGHIPAGWLLEQSGAKKIRVKSARVSKKHANYIINYKGKAKSVQVKELASQLKEKVKEKFGIILEEEIDYLGDFK